MTAAHVRKIDPTTPVGTISRTRAAWPASKAILQTSRHLLRARVCRGLATEWVQN